MLNIGLLGRSRSGKDSACRYLVEHHGYYRVAFADPLREMALALDPIIGVRDVWSDEHGSPQAEYRRLSDLVRSHGWERAKDEYPEVRRVLQRLGLEAVRGVLGDNTWIDRARYLIAAATSAGLPVAVTDVRFANEVHALRVSGFVMVWLDRPGTTDGAHRSEHEVSAEDADYILDNSGTRLDLHTRIERMLAHLA